jgi:uncharacterized protein YdgA (DUF945 family)
MPSGLTLASGFTDAMAFAVAAMHNKKMTTAKPLVLVAFITHAPFSITRMLTTQGTDLAKR